MLIEVNENIQLINTKCMASFKILPYVVNNNLNKIIDIWIFIVTNTRQIRIF